jgi:predicted transport protein
MFHWGFGKLKVELEARTYLSYLASMILAEVEMFH